MNKNEKLQKHRDETKGREVRDSKDWKIRQNLLGFFSLLLEVDKRVNHHSYKNARNRKHS